MSEITIDWQGHKILARLHKTARKKVTEQLKALQVQVLNDMLKPKSGKVYTHPSGRAHRASAPGESPAIWNWRNSAPLVSSIKIDEPKLQGDIWTGAVGTDVDYGVRLHEGRVKKAKGRKKTKRPFLDNALKAQRRLLGKRFREGWVI